MSASFKPEFKVDGQWATNALRFATAAEAEAYASDLFMRWTAPTDKRVAPSDDPVCARLVDGKLEFLS